MGVKIKRWCKWVWRHRHGYLEPPSSSPQTISNFPAPVAHAICMALFDAKVSTA